jgi:7-cyano-7-deazaguanine synthase
MDSIAIAYWKRPQHAFTIDYGQLAAKAEIRAACAVASELGIEHHVLKLDARVLGTGDMAGKLPHSNAPASDWWPYRNQFLVTVAAMRGVTLGITELMLGSVETDAQHRDGTSTFIDRLDRLMKYQEGEIRVTAPAIHMSTVELIRHARLPRSLVAWAHSCHKADLPCGQCRGCNKYVEIIHELSERNEMGE